MAVANNSSRSTGTEPTEPTFLSIDEIEGNFTIIVYNNQTHQTLREKVFCVLGNPTNHQPVHTLPFNPRHISSLTLQLRKYNKQTNTYEKYIGPKVGLWFKIVTDDCSVLNS